MRYGLKRQPQRATNTQAWSSIIGTERHGKRRRRYVASESKAKAVNNSAAELIHETKKRPVTDGKLNRGKAQG